MHHYVFGVDVGGTTVKLGLFSCDGALMDKWEIPTSTEDHGENVLPDIVAAIRAKLEEKRSPRKMLRALVSVFPALSLLITLSINA